MKKNMFIFCLIFSFYGYSQSNFKKFWKASCPIKTWVILHPFKAKKAFLISNEARKVSDSIAKFTLLDGDKNGGQIDAFRHAYWMARLHQEIGKNAALSLGKAHEKDNYITYKKRKLEEGSLPDSIASVMDLYNNTQGIRLVNRKDKISKKGLIFRVINAILQGKMKIIKKNKSKRFLTCKGVLIDEKKWAKKWVNNKCLIASNNKLK